MSLALPVQAICQDFDVPTIAAGGFERINFPGTFIYNPGATAIVVALDAGPRFTIRAGAQYNCPEGTSFRQVVVYNTTAGALKVTLTIGQGRISSVAPPTIERPTQLVDSATISIPAGGNVTFAGTPSATVAQRRGLYLTNLDPAGGQHLIARGDPLAVGGIGCFPQTTILVETSGTVTVHNPGVGAVSVLISENWYITQ